jgi:EpsD family peptidyl-prolyl cis-trans isomerase
VQREILARAYEERYVFPSGAIDEPELHKFYDANPELFSARRIYRTVTFTTDQRQLSDALLAELSKGNTAEALRASLTRQKIKFQTEDARRGAEAMPLPLLPRLGSAKAGDVLVGTGLGGQMQLMLLTGVDDSPLSYEQAADSIAHFLRGQRDQEALKVYLQQLKASAKIEYLDTSGGPVAR